MSNKNGDIVYVTDEKFFRVVKNTSVVLRVIQDGEPCPHTGCVRHITHPCEVCGRTGGVGRVWVVRL